ncbi:hypothetical protein RB195_006394 [Necator americanus]|uniref:Uncharacterized protein n=1 Tax=Necator americanus TaxID=51031 RepID=A0ABR1BVT0_NECAM
MGIANKGFTTLPAATLRRSASREATNAIANIDDLNEGFDDLLLDNDAEVADDVGGDDMTPVVPDTDEYGSDISDYDSDEEAKNSWEGDDQKRG